MSTIDQSKDPTCKVLYSLVSERPALADMVKTAEVGDSLSSKPNSAFADTYNRMFPVDTPANALLSKAYATKCSSLVPHVVHAIDNALSIYGVGLPEKEQVKVAHEEPRYVLEDYKKFPIKEASDVPKAEEALMRVRSKLNTRTLAKAASVLIKAAYASKQNVGDNVLQWAGLTQCDLEKTADWVEARSHASEEGSDLFRKLADNILSSEGPKTREDLLKLADTIEFLDTKYDVTKHYGRRVPNPLETVFNTKTAMQNMIDLGGKEVSLKKLVEIDPKVYSDILGEDILEEITTDGSLDEHKIAEIFDTLPKDMKVLLASKIG